MFRVVAASLKKVVPLTMARNIVGPASTSVRFSHAGLPDIYDPEFDNRYVQYFNRPDIDGWEIRKAMNDLLGMDLIPDPKIVEAALGACRRVNDYALTTRWLEGCREKCCGDEETYKWLINEVKPTLNELGVSTPEELGYGAPELAMKRPHEY